MTEAAERDAADATWRGLTRGQRELLLSTAGGVPVGRVVGSVYLRLHEAGLINDDLDLTHAGRMLIQRRSHP